MQKKILKNLISLSLVVALLISGSLQVMALTTGNVPVKAGELVYTGYLIDNHCGVKGYDDFHKIDLKKNPELHSVDCLKMKECMSSGLGVSIKQADGTYKFIKLDAAGSKLADDKIMMLTAKKTDVMVTLSGTIVNNVLKISAIAETPEHIGYLIDARCGMKGYDDIHKIDLKKSPELHSVDCMKMKECMASGLGISIKQADGTNKFFKLDSAGSKLADDKIMMMTKKKVDLMVAITGVMNNNVITVNKVAEIPEYVGYLIDNHCGVKGYDDFHKIDLKKSPEKHTTSCMKMNECMSSGLGLSLKQADGTYKFIKFDAAGSKMADDKIMMMTKRTFNNKVAAKVNLNGGNFKLVTIKEIQ